MLLLLNPPLRYRRHRREEVVKYAAGQNKAHDGINNNDDDDDEPIPQIAIRAKRAERYGRGCTPDAVAVADGVDDCNDGEILRRRQW